MKLGILTKDVHHKSYDSIAINSYQKDESNEPSTDSNLPPENDDDENVSYFKTSKTYLKNKKFVIGVAAAIVGITYVLCTAIALPRHGKNDKHHNVNNVQSSPTLSSGTDPKNNDDILRENYAFVKGRFKDVTLADQYGRTLSGYGDSKENPIPYKHVKGYCRYLQAQLKDNNGNWKLATYNLDQYFYTDKEGELQYADPDKQPGHYTYSTKSCYIETSINYCCRDDEIHGSCPWAYDVILHAETMYSGGVFGHRDKTKKTSIHIKLANDDGSLVDYGSWVWPKIRHDEICTTYSYVKCTRDECY